MSKEKSVQALRLHGFFIKLLFPFSGASAIHGAERSQKYRVITKSRILGSFQDGNTLPDLFGCLLQSFLADVLLHGAAVDLLEAVHQIISADVEFSGQIVNGQRRSAVVFGQVIIILLKQLLHSLPKELLFIAQISFE